MWHQDSSNPGAGAPISSSEDPHSPPHIADIATADPFRAPSLRTPRRSTPSGHTAHGADLHSVSKDDRRRPRRASTAATTEERAPSPRRPRSPRPRRRPAPGRSSRRRRCRPSRWPISLRRGSPHLCAKTAGGMGLHRLRGGWVSTDCAEVPKSGVRPRTPPQSQPPPPPTPDRPHIAHTSTPDEAQSGRRFTADRHPESIPSGGPQTARERPRTPYPHIAGSSPDPDPHTTPDRLRPCIGLRSCTHRPRRNARPLGQSGCTTNPGVL